MAFLDEVMVADIGRRAREIHAGRTLLTMFASIFFAFGWIAAKLLGAVWLVACWCAVAVKVGWVEARKPTPAARR